MPPSWVDLSSENADGPSTFIKEDPESTGALQISIQAEYHGGTIPNPIPEQLVSYAEGIVNKNAHVQIRGRSTGKCKMGTYGTVLASLLRHSWCQIWVLSNGNDFVLASHTSVDEPSEAEVNEASWVVKNISLQAIPVGL
ncbi:hypothetical protein [Solimicrobium silvestre]|uniref:hypothetical protein n=1 Tax=Solimicrobium silvestre TaxID=2099400 RepID=UPI0010575CA2|nr:hypothetical protein [Solimicrobium silvestre]